MQVVWIAAAHSDAFDITVLQVGATPDDATAALDRLIESHYESFCDGMDKADCGTLVGYRNNFLFDPPGEFKVHGAGLKWVCAVHSPNYPEEVHFTGTGSDKESAAADMYAKVEILLKDRQTPADIEAGDAPVTIDIAKDYIDYQFTVVGPFELE